MNLLWFVFRDNQTVLVVPQEIRGDLLDFEGKSLGSCDAICGIIICYHTD